MLGMKIEGEWMKPLELCEGKRGEPLYKCKIDTIDDVPGIYVFARKFGEVVIPLYIGQATKLKSRIEQQFKNAILMKGVLDAPNGKRRLLVCTIIKPGKNIEKQLDIVEKILIEHSLTEGHDILNIRGARTPVHEVAFSGKKKSHEPFPRKMFKKSK